MCLASGAPDISGKITVCGKELNKIYFTNTLKDKTPTTTGGMKASVVRAVGLEPERLETRNLCV